MLGIEFAIHHHGCLGTESTDRFPEVESHVLASSVAPGGTAAVLMSAESARAEDLSAYLAFWRDRACVRRFEVAAAAGPTALFSVLMAPQRKTVTQVVLDHGAFFSTPIPIAGGLETWRLLLPDARSKSALFAELQDVGIVEVNKVRPVDIAQVPSSESGLLSGLSPRRRELLRIALDEGYFDYPRRVSSRDLAARLGLAQSTLLEHVRKAQRVVLRNALGGSSTQAASTRRWNAERE